MLTEGVVRRVGTGDDGYRCSSNSSSVDACGKNSYIDERLFCDLYASSFKLPIFLVKIGFLVNWCPVHFVWREAAVSLYYLEDLVHICTNVVGLRLSNNFNHQESLVPYFGGVLEAIDIAFLRPIRHQLGELFVLG